MKIFVLSFIAVATVKKSSAFSVSLAAGVFNRHIVPDIKGVRAVSSTKVMAMSASKKSEEVMNEQF
jgi:hypothetical protein